MLTIRYDHATTGLRMKITKVRKNEGKYKIYGWIGKTRKTLFSHSNKKIAEKEYKILLSRNTESFADNRIKLNKGLDLYIDKLNQDVSLGVLKEESASPYIQHIRHFIEPYMGDFLTKYIDDYTYNHFTENYLKSLTMAKSHRNKPLSGKTYQDVIATFKRMIKYWDQKNFYVGECKRILDYRAALPASKKIYKTEFETTKQDVYVLINLEKDFAWQLMYWLALTTGARTNEIVAACFEDFNDQKWLVSHSVDNQNNFCANSVKTNTSHRVIPIQDNVWSLILTWKRLNLYPLLAKDTDGNKLTRLFKVQKTSIKKHTERLAEKAGIKWQGGLSPFRKLSSSLVKDSNKLTDKEFMKWFGWNNTKTFEKHYYRRTKKNTENLQEVFKVSKEDLQLGGKTND